MKPVIAFLVLFFGGVTIAYFMMQPKKEPLPIINPIDLEEEMVDPELLRIGQGHHIGQFSFLNQDGKGLPKWK